MNQDNKAIYLTKNSVSSDASNLKTESLKKQTALQVTQAFLETKSAIENLKNMTFGIEKADKIFEIVKSKYKNNQVIYLEFLKAQNDAMMAELNYELAKNEIWQKYVLLKKQSGIL